ncbi:YeeE/YedE family protein [Comamonas antarctica]|uniref:YeeE/YedE family protein n=1 Tax=Comamonas antarctica TaxID=2743470 RepID=A0A6N1X2A4_9BURK|nr:YeeE/YedE family protein [Comamonas antarctica]QKV53471.1 YeeE/YedE family protein [Comamonas antarctica]
MSVVEIPTQSPPAPTAWQPWAAAALLVLLGWFSTQLQTWTGGRTLVFALSIGMALGVVLQRTRFCFYCHARDWLQRGDPRGILAIVLAWAVGVAGMTVVQGSWVAHPQAGQLPPEMHIGPVSWVLVLAGLAFGAGMAVSGSRISAHWYRLAEGSAVAPFALIGTGLGFALGFHSWNPLYSAAVADAPVVWLPRYLGYGGALAVQLGALGLSAAWIWHRHLQRQAGKPRASAASAPQDLRSLWQSLWTGRWNYALGGLLVGLISVAAIVRMRPLGVTATLGSQVRGALQQHGWVPARLDGLDGFAGCATLPQESWATPNALVLVGLIGGAFVAALASRQFAPRLPTARDALRGIAGGTLLGWGAMTGLGCTIGTLLSGGMAGALSAWVFGAAMLAALWLVFRWQDWLAARRAA